MNKINEKKYIRKMRLQSLWLWWKICYIFFFVTGIFYRHVRSFADLLETAAVCAPMALAADLLLYFAVFRIMFRAKNKGSGGTGDPFERAKEQFDKCMTEGREEDKPKLAELAVTLAGLSVNKLDFKGARDYLSRADMSFYFENFRYEAFKPTVLTYFQILIELDINENNREAADADFSRALPYFDGIEEDSPLFPVVCFSRCQYHIFCGEYGAAEEELSKISVEEADSIIGSNVHLLRGEMLVKRGMISEGQGEIEKAYECCPREEVRIVTDRLGEDIDGIREKRARTAEDMSGGAEAERAGRSEK